MAMDRNFSGNTVVVDDKDKNNSDLRKKIRDWKMESQGKIQVLRTKESYEPKSIRRRRKSERARKNRKNNRRNGSDN